MQPVATDRGDMNLSLLLCIPRDFELIWRYHISEAYLKNAFDLIYQLDANGNFKVEFDFLLN